MRYLAYTFLCVRFPSFSGVAGPINSRPRLTFSSTGWTAPIRNALPEDIVALIDPYKMELDERMAEPIGYVAEAMPKARPESTLGNWLADLLAEQANRLSTQPVDFAIQNYGGIRIPELPAGPLNVGKVYELMPFDNMLVILELDVELLRTFCNQMAADGGWPQSAALRYVINDQQAEDIRINGEPIKSGTTYRVALPDYIANGGGDCDFLVEQEQENTGRLIRDLIIEHVRAQGSTAGDPINSQLDGRLTARQ